MLLLAGCTESVVGTYSNDFFGYSLTLNEDLTGRYKQGEYVVNGTYTVEDGTIIFRYKYNDWGTQKTSTERFVVDGDTVENETGLILRRQK